MNQGSSETNTVESAPHTGTRTASRAETPSTPRIEAKVVEPPVEMVEDEIETVTAPVVIEMPRPDYRESVRQDMPRQMFMF